MSVEFRLPDVGEGIHEAEIVRWLVHEGEMVHEFEPMVEVQTDKAVVELPAPSSGNIEQIVAPAGTLARVGDVLVIIHASTSGRSLGQDIGADAGSIASTDDGAAFGGMSHLASVAARALTPGVEPVQRPKATPAVRQYARDHGISLTDVGTAGPAGRILKSDVDRYRETREVVEQSRRAPSGPVPDDGPPDADAMRRPWYASTKPEHVDHLPPRAPTRVPFRGIRRATAEHVKRSAFTAPHVTAFDECDATELVKLRQRWNEKLERHGQRISYLPFLVKASVSALRAFPYFNARLDEVAQEIELLPEYHIGMAVDTPEGVLVPVIRHADQLTLQEIGGEIYRLSEGARERTLGADELRGSTFTITNMGPIGGLFATPILNYPEVGILAVHRIQRKPVVRGDDIVIREILSLSLSFDHRVIDGATSVRFMNHIKQLIEDPDLLMLELK